VELRQVLKVIGRSWVIIVVTVVVALAAGFLVTKEVTPSYQTETKVLLTPSVQTGDAGDLGPANTVLAAQAPTYAALVTTPLILDPAIKASGAAITSIDLAQDVTASLQAQTSIITITVNADSAEGAAQLANAIAASLIERVKSVSSIVSGVSASGSVVEAPIIPTEPASPNFLLVMLVALAVGLAVAFLVVAFRQALRVSSPAAAAALPGGHGDSGPDGTGPDATERDGTERGEAVLPGHPDSGRSASEAMDDTRQLAVTRESA
jgi:capsular polysaccharide biosynthesis protein